MKRVGFWLRTLALLIDLPLAIIFSVVVARLMAAAGMPTNQSGMSLVVCVLIYSSTEIFLAGTPGKRLLRLKIARNDGTPADRWRLFLRWSTKQCPLVLEFMFLITHSTGFDFFGGFENALIFIGCFFAANDDRLTWHDQWSGTAVYRTRDLRKAYLPPSAAVR